MLVNTIKGEGEKDEEISFRTEFCVGCKFMC